jgi:hypothetical protein
MQEISEKTNDKTLVKNEAGNAPGDVMNEILKAHFARDGGFKQWRATAKKGVSSAV